MQQNSEPMRKQVKAWQKSKDGCYSCVNN